jgi:hypothetical protein
MRRCIFSMEDHYGNIQGGAGMALLPGASGTAKIVEMPEGTQAAAESRPPARAGIRKPPFWAVKRPARPYKSPIQNLFT